MPLQNLGQRGTAHILVAMFGNEDRGESGPVICGGAGQRTT
jgi:hypothetical protein